MYIRNVPRPHNDHILPLRESHFRLVEPLPRCRSPLAVLNGRRCLQQDNMTLIPNHDVPATPTPTMARIIRRL